jgi:nucleotide-binding universal stress UspA family protein
MRVLIAIDGSHEAHQAMTVADELLPEDAEIVLLDVVEPDSALLAAGHDGVIAYPTSAVLELERRRDTQARSSLRVAAAGLAGRDPEVVLDHGHVADRIIEIAREGKMDLVVVGTRDPGWWDRLWSGSVSRKVAADAPCSVLVVR